MDRKTYMEAMERELRRLPKEEREEAILYYSEYFDDAGPEHEAEVIEELGAPKETAAQILREVAIKRLEEPEKAAKKGLSTVWIVILGLCAAPIGLPLLLALITVGLALVICVLAVFFAVLFVGVTLLAAGVIGVGAGFYFMPTQFASALAVAGSSFMVVGIGLLFLLAGCYCCKVIFKGMAKGTRKLLTGGKDHE